MKTICKQLTVLLFALAATKTVGQETNSMTLHCYNVPRACLCDNDHSLDTRPESDEEHLRTYFEKQGLEFPAGSFVKYDPQASVLCMFNTANNHKKFDSWTEKNLIKPSSIELDASFVAFDLPDIESAARKNLSAAPTKSQITELWKTGKGRLLGTQKLITRSGVNAQMQVVDELIYPTEFVDGSDTNTAATRTPPTPASLETRETGMIVNVTPTVTPDGRTIDLVLAPEFSEGDVWDDLTTTLYRGENDEENLTVRQPRFHTAKITTTIAVDDGATSIQGGMASRDGQSLIYLFITARIVDSKGNPIHLDTASKGQGETPKAK